jgi:hypothetical protein
MKEYSSQPYKSGFAIVFDGRIVASILDKQTVDYAVAQLNIHLHEAHDEAQDPHDNIRQLAKDLKTVYDSAAEKDLREVSGYVLDLMLNRFKCEKFSDIRKAMAIAHIPEEV